MQNLLAFQLLKKAGGGGGVLVLNVEKQTFVWDKEEGSWKGYQSALLKRNECCVSLKHTELEFPRFIALSIHDLDRLSATLSVIRASLKPNYNSVVRDELAPLMCNLCVLSGPTKGVSEKRMARKGPPQLVLTQNLLWGFRSDIDPGAVAKTPLFALPLKGGLVELLSGTIKLSYPPCSVRFDFKNHAEAQQWHGALRLAQGLSEKEKDLLPRVVDHALTLWHEDRQPHGCKWNKELLQTVWPTLPGREGASFSVRSPVWKAYGFKTKEPLTELRDTGCLALYNWAFLCLVYPSLWATIAEHRHKYPISRIIVRATQFVAMYMGVGLTPASWAHVPVYPLLLHDADAIQTVFCMTVQMWESMCSRDSKRANLDTEWPIVERRMTEMLERPTEVSTEPPVYSMLGVLLPPRSSAHIVGRVTPSTIEASPQAQEDPAPTQSSNRVVSPIIAAKAAPSSLDDFLSVDTVDVEVSLDGFLNDTAYDQMMAKETTPTKSRQGDTGEGSQPGLAARPLPLTATKSSSQDDVTQRVSRRRLVVRTTPSSPGGKSTSQDDLKAGTGRGKSAPASPISPVRRSGGSLRLRKPIGSLPSPPDEEAGGSLNKSTPNARAHAVRGHADRRWNSVRIRRPVSRPGIPPSSLSEEAPKLPDARPSRSATVSTVRASRTLRLVKRSGRPSILPPSAPSSAPKARPAAPPSAPVFAGSTQAALQTWLGDQAKPVEGAGSKKKKKKKGSSKNETEGTTAAPRKRRGRKLKS